MDGYLFIFDAEGAAFEMFIFKGQRLTIGQVAKDVANGFYAKEIADLEQRTAQHFANV